MKYKRTKEKNSQTYLKIDMTTPKDRVIYLKERNSMTITM